METNKRILLYGKSLILGSIKGILSRCQQFEVTTLAPPLQDVRELDALKPDILLFDLESTKSETVFSMLETNPKIFLIGISPGINLVKVWFIREMRGVSMQDLLQVLKGEAKDLYSDECGDEYFPYPSVENKLCASRDRGKGMGRAMRNGVIDDLRLMAAYAGRLSDFFFGMEVTV